MNYDGLPGVRRSRRGRKGLEVPSARKSRFDTGYTLQRRSIRFNSHWRAGSIGGHDPRVIGIIAAGCILILLALYFMISCTLNLFHPVENKAAETNPVDTRVAAGASESISKALIPELDHADAIKKIAAQANSYSDENIILLALKEPAAASFVAKLPEMSKSPQAYGKTVTKGSTPELYCYDEGWGALDYAGSYFALNGSGPTVMSMVYMNLTGSNDKSPANFAEAATAGKFADGESHTKPEFFSEEAKALNFKLESIKTADEAKAALSAKKLIVCELKAQTLGSEAHWILITAIDGKAQVSIFDPTSTLASQKTHDLASLIAGSSYVAAFSEATQKN